MRRSIPTPASSNGADRPTMPGVGDDPRATLPEPQPPHAPDNHGAAKAPPGEPTDFTRTIPMGSSFATEWLANQTSASKAEASTQESGVHSMDVPAVPAPATKSDRAPATKSDRAPRSSHPTLHSFGAAPPPVIESDDKRWIGRSVEQESVTLRAFTSATPPAAHPEPSAFASTVRTMSAPPPAAAGAPPAQPIQPVRTINISPEIAISARRPERIDSSAHPAAVTLHGVADAPDVSPAAPTIVQGSPRPKTPSDPAPSPELKPQPPPLPSKSKPMANPLKFEAASWMESKRLRFSAIGLIVLALVTGIALILGVPSMPASGTTPAAVAAPPPAVDLKPMTEIVTIPPGAEVILRGALVANTPARLTRPSYESLYLVRKGGYQPQLVALSPHSPSTIRIELHPLSHPSAAPTATTPVTAPPSADPTVPQDIAAPAPSAP